MSAKSLQDLPERRAPSAITRDTGPSDGAWCHLRVESVAGTEMDADRRERMGDERRSAGDDTELDSRRRSSGEHGGTWIHPRDWTSSSATPAVHDVPALNGTCRLLPRE